MTKTQKTFGIDFRMLEISDKTVFNAFKILANEISKMQQEIEDLKAQLNQQK